MNKTVSTLSSQTRGTICDELNRILADGIDLYSQIKVAHWNFKGPLFALWHPQLDEFASAMSKYNDEIAERAVILGGEAFVTARQSAKNSRISEYPKSSKKDSDHIKALASRVEKYAKNLSLGLEIAGELDDYVTTDLITKILGDIEAKSWYLLATLEK